MKLSLNGAKLYVPGDRLRVKDAPDVTVTVIGVQVYSAHVTYDTTWWNNGELKRADFKGWEVEPVECESLIGLNGTHHTRA